MLRRHRMMVLRPGGNDRACAASCFLPARWVRGTLRFMKTTFRYGAGYRIAARANLPRPYPPSKAARSGRRDHHSRSGGFRTPRHGVLACPKMGGQASARTLSARAAARRMRTARRRAADASMASPPASASRRAMLPARPATPAAAPAARPPALPRFRGRPPPAGPDSPPPAGRRLPSGARRPPPHG